MKEQLHAPGQPTAKKQAGSFFQPKLTINQPSDVYEQEADAMADKVMQMKDNTGSPFFKPAAFPVQRKCTHCEAEEKSLQRKEVPSVQREDKAADDTGKVLSEGAGVVMDQLGENPAFEAWKKKQAEELKLKLWDQQPTELKAGLISFGLMGAGILGSALALDPGFRRSTTDFLQDKNLALPLSLIPHHEYFGLSSFKYKLPSATSAPYTFETEFELDAFFDLMREKWNIPQVSLGVGVDSSYSPAGGFSPFTGGKIKLKLGGGVINVSGFYNQPLPPVPMLISNPAAGESPMWLMRSLPGQLGDNLLKGSGIFFTIDVMRIGELLRLNRRKPTVQRKENSTAGGEGAAPSIVDNVLSSHIGAPLDGTTQHFMESRFGHDFSGVRIHTGGKAAASASAIQARAYTSGNEIVFGDGEYQPGTDAGKHLLAHELTHVIQQQAQQTKAPVQRVPQEQPRAANAQESREFVVESTRNLTDSVGFFSQATIDQSRFDRVLDGWKTNAETVDNLLATQLNDDTTLQSNFRSAYNMALLTLLNRAAAQLHQPAARLYLLNLHRISAWASFHVSDIPAADAAAKQTIIQSAIDVFNDAALAAQYTTFNASNLEALLSRIKTFAEESREMLRSDLGNDLSIASQLKMAYRAAILSILTRAATDMRSTVYSLYMTYRFSNPLILDWADGTQAGFSTRMPMGLPSLTGRNQSIPFQGITVTLLPDGTQRSANARTNIRFNYNSAVRFRILPRNGGIESHTGPGIPSATIQTLYGPGAATTSRSAYGRGTTATDIGEGNTSLGFHEGSHGVDFIAFFQTHSLPVFTGTDGMSTADFQTAISDYSTALDRYKNDIVRFSELQTDCVGITIEDEASSRGQTSEVHCP